MTIPRSHCDCDRVNDDLTLTSCDSVHLLRLRALSRQSPRLSLITDHDQKICLFTLATAFHGICIDDDTYSYRLRLLSDKISTALLFGLSLLPDAIQWSQACSLQARKSAKHPRTKFVTTFFPSSHFRSRSAPAILAI
jgi:hypothetical protein